MFSQSGAANYAEIPFLYLPLPSRIVFHLPTDICPVAHMVCKTMAILICPCFSAICTRFCIPSSSVPYFPAEKYFAVPYRFSLVNRTTPDTRINGLPPQEMNLSLLFSSSYRCFLYCSNKSLVIRLFIICITPHFYLRHKCHILIKTHKTPEVAPSEVFYSALGGWLMP